MAHEKTKAVACELSKRWLAAMAETEEHQGQLDSIAAVAALWQVVKAVGACISAASGRDADAGVGYVMAGLARSWGWARRNGDMDEMARVAFDAKLERDLEEMEHGTDQMGA